MKLKPTHKLTIVLGYTRTTDSANRGWYELTYPRLGDSLKDKVKERKLHSRLSRISNFARYFDGVIRLGAKNVTLYRSDIHDPHSGRTKIRFVCTIQLPGGLNISSTKCGSVIIAIKEAICKLPDEFFTKTDSFKKGDYS